MRRHRIVPIREVGSLVGIAMPAIFAFVNKVLRHLRLFREEITGRVVGNLGEDAFRMTAFTAQHPFRIGRHSVEMITFAHLPENRADTLSIYRYGSSFHC